MESMCAYFIILGTEPTAHADFYSLFLFSVSPPSMMFLLEGPYEAFFFFFSFSFFDHNVSLLLPTGS